MIRPSRPTPSPQTSRRGRSAAGSDRSEGKSQPGPAPALTTMLRRPCTSSSRPSPTRNWYGVGSLAQPWRTMCALSVTAVPNLEAILSAHVVSPIGDGAMTVKEVTLAIFAVCISIRVVAYVPQRGIFYILYDVVPVPAHARVHGCLRARQPLGLGPGGVLRKRRHLLRLPFR